MKTRLTPIITLLTLVGLANVAKAHLRQRARLIPANKGAKK